MDAIKIGRKGYILQTNLSPKNLKQLNEQIQVNKELTFIEKNGEEVLCYCKMRNTNCFETYQYDCPNYRELTKEEEK